MPGLTDFGAERVLALLKTGYLGLLTSRPDDAEGADEVGEDEYVRVALTANTWNDFDGSAPRFMDNALQVKFATADHQWPTPVIAWGIFDAAVGGNLLHTDYMGDGAWLPFAAAAGDTALVVCPGHDFQNGDKAVVSTEFGGALPDSDDDWAELLTIANVNGDQFTLGVGANASGSGMIRRVSPITVVKNSFIFFDPGQLRVGAV